MRDLPLFDFPPDPVPDLVPSPRNSAASWREALSEQMIRDGKVLAGDPRYHEPSADFYAERIVLYSEALKQLDEETS